MYVIRTTYNRPLSEQSHEQRLDDGNLAELKVLSCACYNQSQVFVSFHAHRVALFHNFLYFSCNAGYSGDRCQVDVCQGYCLHDAVCSLSEESKPLCQCTGHYEGERCEFPVFLIKCSKTVSLLKDLLNTGKNRCG